MNKAERLFERFPDYIKNFIYENSWSSLRDVQISAAESIFESDNNLLLSSSTASGKTEAAKHVARLLDRTLFCVNFDNLIDSKLGQTNRNISKVFNEINMLPICKYNPIWSSQYTCSS